MNLLFLLGGITALSIFILTTIKFFKHYEDKGVAKIIQSILIIGLASLLLSIISFLWAFNTLTYSSADFLIIYAVYITIQTIILFRINHIFVPHKGIKYLFISYAILLILASIIFNSSIPALILSLIVSLLLFTQFTFRDDIYARAGVVGISYSVISIIMFLLYIINIIDIYPIIFTGIPFLFFISMLFSDFRRYPVLNKTEKIKHEKPYFLVLLSHLIFIITFINFILIGTIAIHEFGHYGMSKVYDCKYGKIVYENDLFHTEFLCRDSSSTLGTAMGGILLPILIALVLFVVGGKLMKEIAMLITGFNLVAISRDLLLINVSENIVTLSIITGIILSIIGIFLLAKSRSTEIIYF